MDRIVEGFLVAANAGIQSAESPYCARVQGRGKGIGHHAGIVPTQGRRMRKRRGCILAGDVCGVGQEDCLALGRVILLLERLVGPEADDGQSQRIDGQLIILHVVAEDIGHAGGPSLPLEFGMVRRVPGSCIPSRTQCAPNRVIAAGRPRRRF